MGGQLIHSYSIQHTACYLILLAQHLWAAHTTTAQCRPISKLISIVAGNAIYSNNINGG